MLELPSDVIDLVSSIFADCNYRVSAKMSRIPTVHETSLDMTFIEHFSQQAVPIALPSSWTVRLDTHYLGGGRHFGSWEIADIGFLVIFRRRGKLVKSKVALLQAKRLYPKEQAFSEDHPMDYRIGFGRLHESDDEFAEATKPREFTFDETCRYRALIVADDQYQAIKAYESQYGIPVHYMLYHPLRIPSTAKIPLQSTRAPRGPLKIGCRVIRSQDLRSGLKNQSNGYAPSYGDLAYLLPEPFNQDAHVAGWRLEHFVANLLIQCHEGYVTDQGLTDDGLITVFNRRSGPISAAVSITFDAPE